MGDPLSLFSPEPADELPDEVRQIFLYTVCQTMVQSGLLELVGVSAETESGTTLIYRNPDTGQFIEITKPEMSEEEDRAMKDHIREQLIKSS